MTLHRSGMSTKQQGARIVALLPATNSLQQTFQMSKNELCTHFCAPSCCPPGLPRSPAVVQTFLNRHKNLEDSTIWRCYWCHRYCVCSGADDEEPQQSQRCIQCSLQPKVLVLLFLSLLPTTMVPAQAGEEEVCGCWPPTAAQA